MKRTQWKRLGLIAFIGTICALAYAAEKQATQESSLSVALKSAIDRLFPEATIKGVGEEEEGLDLCEVELVHKGQAHSVTGTADGIVASVETEMAMEALPKAVAEALTKSAAGATIKEVSQEVTYAVVKLVPLDKLQTTYEAQIVKDGKPYEIKVAADGTTLKMKVVDEEKDEDEKDDKKD